MSEGTSLEENSEISLKPVKLPYFHRELPPEERELIGDITPKRVDTPNNNNINNSNNNNGNVVTQLEGNSTIGSAWNAALTWEEKNCTSWARECLEELFASLELSGRGWNFAVNSLKDFRGHATATNSRGKLRYLYDVSFDLNFDLDTNASDVFTGKIELLEVSNDQLDDLEVHLEWKNKPKSDLLRPMTQFVQHDEVRELLKATFREFEKRFRDRYR